MRFADGEQVMGIDAYIEGVTVQIAVAIANGDIARVDFTDGHLVEMWAKRIQDVVPRGVQFTNDAKQILAFGMLDGQV